MKIVVCSAGKPSLDDARKGIAEYHKRLVHYGRYELVQVKEGDSSRVSTALLARSEGCYRIALDERGEELNTQQWAEILRSLSEREQVKTLAFLIGTADGHTPSLRATCSRVWRLSALTLQHELALLVLLEQLYRVATLHRGEPYHR